MKIKNLKCTLNMPVKWQEDYNGMGETNPALPPYAPLNMYCVDEYEACPPDWMHGSDKSGSFFVGVKEDYALWLDFNDCFQHTHDVAIVLSVQGINPITGQKMVGKKALKLEQYHSKCPVHNVKFQQDRYCKKCDFKWPGQNYLSSTGTPHNFFWLDGFRAPDGRVRQYIITAEKMRGIASQLIGKERVFAIGIAFYLSKKRKPELPKPIHREVDDGQTWNKPFIPSMPDKTLYCLSADVDDADDPQVDNFIGFAGNLNLGNANGAIGTSIPSKSTGISSSKSTTSCSTSRSLTANSIPHSKGRRVKTATIQAAGAHLEKVKQVTPVKKLEVGAGALINQLVYDDTKEMSYWEKRPAGMIYINYCDEETFKNIKKAGKRGSKKDGFMQDLKVGS